jgi:CheY-like chemotaxis protein
MMSNQKPTLLVADDDISVRNLIRETFEDCCEIIEATNGMEAIEKALKCLPNCITLDLMMPELGGHVVCEVLKQIRRTRMIPVVIVSAKDAGENQQIAFESGAVDFITKPFHPLELKRRVLDVIAERPREKRAASRLVIALPVRIQSISPEAGFCIHTITEDISRRGLRFHGDFHASVGDVIEVFQLSSSGDGKSIYAGRAQVVWVNARYAPLLHCGAKFLEVSPQWLVKS